MKGLDLGFRFGGHSLGWGLGCKGWGLGFGILGFRAKRFGCRNMALGFAVQLGLRLSGPGFGDKGLGCMRSTHEKQLDRRCPVCFGVLLYPLYPPRKMCCFFVPLLGKVANRVWGGGPYRNPLSDHVQEWR